MARDEQLDTGQTVQEAYDHEAYVEGEAESNGDTTPPVRGFDAQGPLSSASVVDLLRREQQELADAKTVFIPVKGYEQTGLQIRYKMPGSGKELDIILQKINRQTKDTYTRNLLGATDTMIHLCDGIFVQPEGVDEPVMLDPEETGEPVGFDSVLAELLGMDTADSNLTARTVLGKLFGGNELAIMTHAFDLNRWLQNTKADLNLEVWQVGE